MRREHPMLFKDRLVRALLDGSKTQTRRPVTPQPVYSGRIKNYMLSGCDRVPGWDWKDGFFADTATPGQIACHFSGKPYRVGDLIWCRETWAPNYTDMDGWPVHYRADLPVDRDDALTANHAFGLMRWKPNIHMRKADCRLWLEITDVRVERIQSISDDDIEAEGASAHMPDCHLYPSPNPCGWKHVLDSDGYSVDGEPECDCGSHSYMEIFGHNWNRIYPGSWERNDWVFALTVKRTEAKK